MTEPTHEEQVAALEDAVHRYEAIAEYDASTALRAALARLGADQSKDNNNESVRWGLLRLLSGPLWSDDETVDAVLELDDFQLWFQDRPKATGFKQIVINLSGAQWKAIKDLPVVAERSPPADTPSQDAAGDGR